MIHASNIGVWSERCNFEKEIFPVFERLRSFLLSICYQPVEIARLQIVLIDIISQI
jgi:hypothetical protein